MLELKAERFEEAKIVAIKVSQEAEKYKLEAEKYKREAEETKKVLESHENESSTSEMTDTESYEDVCYENNNFHNQQYGPAFIQYPVNHYPQPMAMPIPISQPVFYGNQYPMMNMILINIIIKIMIIILKNLIKNGNIHTNLHKLYIIQLINFEIVGILII